MSKPHINTLNSMSVDTSHVASPVYPPSFSGVGRPLPPAQLQIRSTSPANSESSAVSASSSVPPSPTLSDHDHQPHYTLKAFEQPLTLRPAASSSSEVIGSSSSSSFALQPPSLGQGPFGLGPQPAVVNRNRAASLFYSGPLPAAAAPEPTFLPNFPAETLQANLNTLQRDYRPFTSTIHQPLNQAGRTSTLEEFKDELDLLPPILTAHEMVSHSQALNILTLAVAKYGVSSAAKVQQQAFNGALNRVKAMDPAMPSQMQHALAKAVSDGHQASIEVNGQEKLVLNGATRAENLIKLKTADQESNATTLLDTVEIQNQKLKILADESLVGWFKRQMWELIPSFSAIWNNLTPGQQLATGAAVGTVLVYILRSKAPASAGPAAAAPDVSSVVVVGSSTGSAVALTQSVITTVTKVVVKAALQDHEPDPANAPWV